MKRIKIYFSSLSYWVIVVVLITTIQDIVFFPNNYLIGIELMFAIMFFDIVFISIACGLIKKLNNIKKSKIEDSHERFWDRKVALRYSISLLILVSLKSLIMNLI